MEIGELQQNECEIKSQAQHTSLVVKGWSFKGKLSESSKLREVTLQRNSSGGSDDHTNLAAGQISLTKVCPSSYLRVQVINHKQPIK